MNKTHHPQWGRPIAQSLEFTWDEGIQLGNWDRSPAPNSSHFFLFILKPKDGPSCWMKLRALRTVFDDLPELCHQCTSIADRAPSFLVISNADTNFWRTRAKRKGPRGSPCWTPCWDVKIPIVCYIGKGVGYSTMQPNNNNNLASIPSAWKVARMCFFYR